MATFNASNNKEFNSITELKAIATLPKDNDNFNVVEGNIRKIYNYESTSTATEDGDNFLILNNFNGRFVKIADGELDYTFETISKNLKSYPYTLNYTSGKLTSIVYTLPSGTITKTLNYTSEKLTSIVLSGDTPSGIDLTKTLAYTGDTLTGITYS